MLHVFTRYQTTTGIDLFYIPGKVGKAYIPISYWILRQNNLRYLIHVFIWSYAASVCQKPHTTRVSSNNTALVTAGTALVSALALAARQYSGVGSTQRLWFHRISERLWAFFVSGYWQTWLDTVYVRTPSIWMLIVTAGYSVDQDAFDTDTVFHGWMQCAPWHFWYWYCMAWLDTVYVRTHWIRILTCMAGHSVLLERLWCWYCMRHRKINHFYTREQRRQAFGVGVREQFFVASGQGRTISVRMTSCTRYALCHATTTRIKQLHALRNCTHQELHAGTRIKQDTYSFMQSSWHLYSIIIRIIIRLSLHNRPTFNIYKYIFYRSMRDMGSWLTLLWRVYLDFYRFAVSTVNVLSHVAVKIHNLWIFAPPFSQRLKVYVG